ncbi:Hcp family type VI secretion system effector [Thalassotalea litorea]|uniref:Hcp family type VI secretion system effector n=1 Tax=Thalassotalea litorea TaxID=2020715 RepID=UPI003735C05A
MKLRRHRSTSKKLSVFKALLLTNLMAFSSLALSYSNTFLLIEGVKGESQYANYKGGIEIESWSWATSQSEKGRCLLDIQDMSITKYADIASAPLLIAQATGEVYPTAVLVVLDSSAVGTGGGNPGEYVRVELTNAMVTSLATNGTSSDSRLTEDLELSFEQLQITYTSRDGSQSTTAAVSNNCN